MSHAQECVLHPGRAAIYFKTKFIDLDDETLKHYESHEFLGYQESCLSSYFETKFKGGKKKNHYEFFEFLYLKS